MICMEMSGNGVRIISMITMMGLLLMGVCGKVEVAPSVFSGAVAGASTPGSAGQRAAMGASPASAAATSVSVS